MEQDQDLKIRPDGPIGKKIIDQYLSGQIDFGTYWEYLSAKHGETSTELQGEAPPIAGNDNEPSTSGITPVPRILESMGIVRIDNDQELNEKHENVHITSETQRLLKEFYGEMQMETERTETEREVAHLMIGMGRGGQTEDEVLNELSGRPGKKKRKKSIGLDEIHGKPRKRTTFRKERAKREQELINAGTAVHGNLEDAIIDEKEYERQVLGVKGLTRERSRTQQLPETLEALLGQANVTFAKGNAEDAISMIQEIIRQHAQAYSPYQALAAIYDTIGDEEKYLQFGLMGAYLDYKTCGSTWADLGRLCEKTGKEEQAIVCYAKACRQCPFDKDLWEKRLGLLRELEEKSMEVRCRLDYLKAMSVHDSYENFRDLAKQFILDFGQNEDGRHQLVCYRTFLDRAKKENVLDYDDVSVCLDLMDEHQKNDHFSIVKFLLSMGVAEVRHSEGKAIDLCLLDIEPAPREDRATRLLRAREGDRVIPRSVSMTGQAPVHLFSRLIQSSIIAPLRDVKLTKLMISEFERITRLDSEFSLDIAESLQTMEKYSEAHNILSQALKLPQCINSVRGWEMIGQILEVMESSDEAASAYRKALSIDPAHVSARVSLANLHSMFGQNEAALETILNAEEEANELKDERLLKAEVDLFYSGENWKGFLRSGWLLLMPYFSDAYNVTNHKDSLIRIPNEDRCQISFGVRNEFIRVFKNSWMEKLIRKTQKLMKVQRSERILEADQLYEICFKICDTLCNHGRYWDAFLTAGYSYMNPTLVRQRLSSQFVNIALFTAVRGGSPKTAFYILREVFGNMEDDMRVWNGHSLVFALTQDVIFHKFILRRMKIYPENPCLAILAGNNSLISGSYIVALTEYLAVLRHCPQSALVNFLAGLTLLHISCKKDIAKRHIQCVQALSFLVKYDKLRGCEQEVCYNMGRAMHQANILFAAIHYYKKVLNMPAVEGLLENGERNVYDLRPMAAYNLALIYKGSGNMDLAIDLLYKYCTLT